MTPPWAATNHASAIRTSRWAALPSSGGPHPEGPGAGLGEPLDREAPEAVALQHGPAGRRVAQDLEQLVPAHGGSTAPSRSASGSRSSVAGSWCVLELVVGLGDVELERMPERRRPVVDRQRAHHDLAEHLSGSGSGRCRPGARAARSRRRSRAAARPHPRPDRRPRQPGRREAIEVQRAAGEARGRSRRRRTWPSTRRGARPPAARRAPPRSVLRTRRAFGGRRRDVAEERDQLIARDPFDEVQD